MNRTIFLAATLATAAAMTGSALAGPTAAQKCGAAKNKIAGAYYNCRTKAEAVAILKNLSPDFTKCDEKFTTKWNAAETAGDGNCVDSVPTAGTIKPYLEAQASEASDIIAGDDCEFDGGTRVAGSCWFLGASGLNCNTICAGAGRVYSTATETYAGSSAADFTGCQAVANAVSPGLIMAGDQACGSGFNGCVEQAGQVARCTTPATDATSSNPSARRFCACS